MRGSKENGERPEQVRKDKKGPAKLEPLRPQAKQSDIPRDDLAKFSSENPYPVLRIHKDGTVLYANKAGEPLLKARGSGVGRPAPAQWHQLVKKALSSGQVIREETEHNGRVFAFRAVPIADSDYVNFYGVDITDRKHAEQALYESELRYRSIFEQAADSIVVLDAQTERITEFNDKAHESLGYTREEFAKLILSDIEAKESKEETEAHINMVVRRGNDTFETRQRKKDGTLCDILVSAKPITIAGRQYIQGIWRDITERKKAEEEMVRLNRVMETIADVNQLIFRIQDKTELSKKICEAISAHAYKMVWIGFYNDQTKLIEPQAQAGFEEGHPASPKITYDGSEYRMGPSDMAAKTAKPDVMRFITTDPRYGPWREEATKHGYRSLAAIPILKGDKVIGVLNVYADKEDVFGQEEVKLLEELANDISTGLRGIDEQARRRHAEQKLLEYQKQLKRLATRLTLTEERERRRIAGELHDQVNQSLALAKIKLDTLRAMPMPEPAEEVLTEIGDTLESVIDDTRSLIFNISSPILHELGFEAAAAEWLNEQVQDKHGIAAEFKDDGQPKPLDDDVRVLLFRNVRELLINAIKHASAGKVKVRIRRIDDSIEVVVEDNGVGFDPMEARSMAAKRAEFGLFSIRESLEELGGRFEIESKPGAGCKATMTAPLKRKGMDDERNKAAHQGNGN